MNKSLLVGLLMACLLTSQMIFSQPLRPGDIVKIKFPGEANFNKSFQLDLNGHLTLP